MSETGTGATRGGEGGDPRGRGGLIVALLVLVGVGAFGLRAAFRDGAEELTLEERYLADDRLVPLIYDCGYGKHFDAQTVDMTPTLVSKLDRGARDPLRLAKQELAEIGPDAVPELRRLFNEVYQDAWKHGVVENVLAVCSLMEGPWGLELLRTGIRHPQETVRLAALAGLKRHGGPEDYDVVVEMMSLAGSAPTRAEFGSALVVLDRERFQRDLVEWLENGVNQDIWAYTITELADVEDPVLIQRMLAAAEIRDVSIRPFLIAPAARSGNTAALEELQRLVAEGRPAERQVGIQALANIGRVLDGTALLRDPNAGVRRMAYTQLVEHGDAVAAPEEVTTWLEEGVLDDDPDIRARCLQELVARGNAFARGEALRMLERHPGERSLAIQALRDHWDENPGAAEEAFARLMDLYQLTADQPGERLGVLQTLSQVPLQDTSDFLLDLARQSSGEVKGMDAHRFLVGQVWNTGPQGRELLRQELRVETDPFRRLSLIEYVWQDHLDVSREVLLAVAQDDARDPFERLYAADRAIRIGPASAVAPVLKRVYQECTHPIVRPAFQCLLWTWYGQHFD